MGWRKVEKKDIEAGELRGVVIRFTSMKDTPYNGATIIMADASQVHFARPYAYACKEYDSKQPYLGCEVVSVFVTRFTADTSDIEVYENSRGQLLRMAT